MGAVQRANPRGGIMTSQMNYAWEDSPVGRLLIAADEQGLRQLLFAEGRSPVRPEAGWVEGARPLADAIAQLRAYFRGELRQFDLRVAPAGTPFQQRVW